MDADNRRWVGFLPFSIHDNVSDLLVLNRFIRELDYLIDILSCAYSASLSAGSQLGSDKRQINNIIRFFLLLCICRILFSSVSVVILHLLNRFYSKRYVAHVWLANRCGRNFCVSKHAGQRTGTILSLSALLFFYELEGLEVGLHYWVLLGFQYDLARGQEGFHVQNFLTLDAAVSQLILMPTSKLLTMRTWLISSRT